MTKRNSTARVSHLANRIVRGLDADWIEERAAEAARALASWQAWSWEDRALRYRDFRGAYLCAADFRKLDLTGSWFDGAVLVGARFDGARLDAVTFEQADMRSARFDPGWRPRSDLASTAVHQFDHRTTRFEFVDAAGQLLRIVKATTWRSAVYEYARSRGIEGFMVTTEIDRARDAEPRFRASCLTSIL